MASTAKNPSIPQGEAEEQAQASPRCSQTTKAGAPCRARPLKGADTCLAHSDQETRGSISFGGAQPGGGRPKSPRVVDVLRERLEAEADAWLKVLTDAREAERGVVVGDGEAARVEFFEDHPTRLKAFREVFDRGYGKPMQFHDVTSRADESTVDREIAELLGEMSRNDPSLSEVAEANGNGSGH